MERLKIQTKKNRPTVFLICLVFFAGFLTTGCGRGISNHLEVLIELPDPGSLNFDDYKTVLYKDLEVEGMPENFDPTSRLRNFFIADLSRSIDKKVQQWNESDHGELVPKGLAIISGKLKMEIKSRSKITDDKSEGKGKKKFVTVEHWSMTLELKIKDESTGKEIYEDSFTAKLANAEPDSIEFNFENLFYKVTNRFIHRVTRTKKMQRRHLLIENNYRM
jgi:hypothetical protein